MAGEKPKVPYWHVWTDAEGVSHQDRFELTEFDLKTMKPPADPQWQGTRFTNRSTVMVTVQPVGWVGQWHENPKPQWIVPLSGRWFVETLDGTRVEMGPGELSFGEDQNTRPDAQGRQGHLSGTVGDAPAVLMVVQIEDAAPTIGQPGRFR
ncbi:cupin domain-containing protein [Methylobacterium durans]|uniref:cupin domain-containing protein n=1 Tax=Methylobacterium durans TaxID=2202825 RepID=UPI002AFF003E|nr:cupin domain-containing protein [Methylobacterium durans]MEA1835073.1 cupin domain-containing protein [Methylobacterium durans]